MGPTGLRRIVRDGSAGILRRSPVTWPLRQRGRTTGSCMISARANASTGAMPSVAASSVCRQIFTKPIHHAARRRGWLSNSSYHCDVLAGAPGKVPAVAPPPPAASLPIRMATTRPRRLVRRARRSPATRRSSDVSANRTVRGRLAGESASRARKRHYGNRTRTCSRAFTS